MDALQQALRAVLQRTIDQRSQAEVEVQRNVRSLRVRLEAAEAPVWPGELVALMQPAPPKSRDERWFAAMDATAEGPRRLAVPAPAANGPAFGYPQVREYAQALVAALAAQYRAAAQVALSLPGLAHGLDEGACLEHLLLGLVDALAVQASAGSWQELVLLEPNDGRRRLLADKLDALLAATTPPGASLHRGAWSLVYFPAAAGAARPPAPFESHLTYQDMLTAFVAMPFRADMRDIFQYGIQAPALRARFKAERLDFRAFHRPRSSSRSRSASSAPIWSLPT
ncbi:MAG: hypothetical protein IPQ21_20230 [Betaproteobacteria bacterium]|nr:hypothetical protein [Betaproteobacteria bacterium]